VHQSRNCTSTLPKTDPPTPIAPLQLILFSPVSGLFGGFGGELLVRSSKSESAPGPSTEPPLGDLSPCPSLDNHTPAD
jgi:hypothetical protein